MKKYSKPSIHVVKIENQPFMAGSMIGESSAKHETEDFIAGARRKNGWYDDEEEE